MRSRKWVVTWKLSQTGHLIYLFCVNLSLINSISLVILRFTPGLLLFQWLDTPTAVKTFMKSWQFQNYLHWLTVNFVTTWFVDKFCQFKKRDLLEKIKTGSYLDIFYLPNQFDKSVCSLLWVFLNKEFITHWLFKNISWNEHLRETIESTDFCHCLIPILSINLKKLASLAFSWEKTHLCVHTSHQNDKNWRRETLCAYQSFFRLRVGFKDCNN